MREKVGGYEYHWRNILEEAEQTPFKVTSDDQPQRMYLLGLIHSYEWWVISLGDVDRYYRIQALKRRYGWR